MNSEFSDSVPMTVLIVDCFVDAAETLSLLLELCGYDTSIVHSAEEALLVASHITPDVVIIELRLPGMDGYELAKRLHAMPHEPTCIAVTTCSQTETIQKSRAAGIFKHLIKPVAHDAMLEALADVTSGRKRSLQLA